MPEPAAQLYRVQLLNWHFTVKLSKLFLLFFSLFYQFNINIFPWHCLCGAAGTETWAIGTETKMIWKGNKIINRKYLKFEELAFPFKHLALGWHLPKVQGRGQQDSSWGGTDATSPLLCLVPRTPLPGVQQSHSPTCNKLRASQDVLITVPKQRLHPETSHFVLSTTLPNSPGTYKGWIRTFCCSPV